VCVRDACDWSASSDRDLCASARTLHGCYSQAHGVHNLAGVQSTDTEQIDATDGLQTAADHNIVVHRYLRSSFEATLMHTSHNARLWLVFIKAVCVCVYVYVCVNE